jgi:exonuclease V gamma subunit
VSIQILASTGFMLVTKTGGSNVSRRASDLFDLFDLFYPLRVSWILHWEKEEIFLVGMGDFLDLFRHDLRE